jgi:hypothetical protein
MDADRDGNLGALESYVAFSPQSGEYVADNKKGEHRAMLTLHHQGWFYGRVSIDRWIRR